jgi:hypothetical protein
VGVLKVKDGVFDPDGAKKELDKINQKVDSELLKKKQPTYYRKGEPTSLLEGDFENPGVSITSDSDGITVRRPFV